MQFKDAAGMIVCSVYNTPEDAKPVAQKCPVGTWTEQLFDDQWNQLPSEREVTVVSSDSTQPSDGMVSGIDAIEITQTSARIAWDAGEPATGQVFYGKTPAYGMSTNKEDSFTYSRHRQSLSGLEPDTQYHVQAVSQTQDGRRLVSADFTFRTLGSTPDTPPAGGSSGGSWTTYAQIQADGLSNAAYPDVDHYTAEFLYQNPDVCFWQNDHANQRIRPVATPTAPADAVRLPAPSGGDDTSALQAAFRANAGKAVVGQGTYKVKGLEVDVSVDIFGLNLEPATGAGEMVRVSAPDVRFFGAHIDVKSQGSVYLGWRVNAGADRFHLVGSTFKNMHHTGKLGGGGVMVRSVKDYHIACNRFEDIINDPSDPTVTARANAIWLKGGGENLPSYSGYIVNNTGVNFQSAGARNDSEFFTIQSHRSAEGTQKIFANRCVNAGKRFTKWQTSGGLVLSNDYHWRDARGPLGLRVQLRVVELLTRSDRVTFRNNRIKLAGAGRYDGVLTIHNMHPHVTRDVHMDSNDVHMIEDAAAAYFGPLISGRNSGGPKEATGSEALNSSIKDNVFRGPGRPSYLY